MGRFYPLYIRRSDGKLEIVSRTSKRKERNEPTPEQLDQKPDKHGVADYYREVPLDEVKSLDWRRKLGGMLARELAWKDQAGQTEDIGYMLASFPEGYRLFEHVKKTERDGKTEVKSKNHAGGANDRQDAYLYGHPSGRKKRFRSPADFFPHLLWLSTDESGDPDNCGCKICSPEDLENAIPGAKVKVERSTDVKPVVSQAAVPAARQSSISGSRVKQEPPLPTPVRTPSVSTPIVPTPLPQRKFHDQHIDSQYHTFMYRPGETVWFRRGQAWGLGVVLRRWVATGDQYNYTVQPLSWPGDYPQPVTKSSDQEMRPWLAWSVPRFTNDVLNNLQEPPSYDNADWQGMLHKRYGNGDMEVDGSILAAKAVDCTYTPFNFSKSVEPEPGLTEKHYDGLYLGAEKIWVGDPVRLQTANGTDIMVVHSVVEGRRVSAMGNQVLQQSCYLIGDVYSISTVPHSNPALPTPASPSNNPHLPLRLTEDLANRNARSIAARRQASFWKLVATQRRLEISDVKGRWYEASLLLPILQQQQYDESARQGLIQEASQYMNSRGDCQNSNRSPSLPRVERTLKKKDTRKEALGRAVPPNAEIVDGVSPPQANAEPASRAAAGLSGAGSGQGSEVMEIDPRFETSSAGDAKQRALGGAAGGLDDFMNVDGMEDSQGSMPGFGREYGSQSQGGY
ncbi:hypothetical protein D0859_06251 [Hortaea werneckii]|uniref:Cryptic loci regulator 2 N-terminal domain-containing protein n=1 Tax=Hortaea werneckii TaxID=91943 RepID=A0A3M7IWB6_HORWE|nr:hypothetical protein D0859_06251 [Hortaea werneckii]